MAGYQGKPWRVALASEKKAPKSARECLCLHLVQVYPTMRDSEMQFNLKQTLRALLMSTSEPLSIRDIQGVITRYHQQADPANHTEPEEPSRNDPEQEEMDDIMEQVPSLLTATQIRDAMDEIAAEFIDRQEVCRLVQGPSGYRLTSAPEFANWVRLLRNESRPIRLSQAAMETLAIIAYRQPVTRAEIEAIRGVSIDSALGKLQELELVHVSGRAELPGRPLQFGTTDRFLEFTGVRSIEELPASDVLSPTQLTQWIRESTSDKRELGNLDMGLAEEETASKPENEDDEAGD